MTGEATKPKRKKLRIDRKQDLANAWRLATSTDFPFVGEHYFHPTRQWRFDWAHLELLIAVEVEGVTHFGPAIGRHQSAAGIEGDMEKYNAAALLGWTVLRYSQRMIKKDPVGVVEQIVDVAEVVRTKQSKGT